MESHQSSIVEVVEESTEVVTPHEDDVEQSGELRQVDEAAKTFSDLAETNISNKPHVGEDRSEKVLHHVRQLKQGWRKQRKKMRRDIAESVKKKSHRLYESPFADSNRYEPLCETSDSDDAGMEAVERKIRAMTMKESDETGDSMICLLYTSPSPRD